MACLFWFVKRLWLNAVRLLNSVSGVVVAATGRLQERRNYVPEATHKCVAQRVYIAPLLHSIHTHCWKHKSSAETTARESYQYQRTVQRSLFFESSLGDVMPQPLSWLLHEAG